MSTSTPTQPPQRQDRRIREEIHDTYKMRGQPKGPARCPGCKAVYYKGRWSWSAEAPADANEVMCSACQRTRDDYPAGEVTLAGDFALSNKDEILNLVRNIESAENGEHPMNRIIGIKTFDDRILITTTDVHLPRRIGKAVQSAWKGELDIHFDETGYFTRISWFRG